MRRLLNIEQMVPDDELTSMKKELQHLNPEDQNLILNEFNNKADNDF